MDAQGENPVKLERNASKTALRYVRREMKEGVGERERITTRS